MGREGGVGESERVRGGGGTCIYSNTETQQNILELLYMHMYNIQ